MFAGVWGALGPVDVSQCCQRALSPFISLLCLTFELFLILSIFFLFFSFWKTFGRFTASSIRPPYFAGGSVSRCPGLGVLRKKQGVSWPERHLECHNEKNGKGAKDKKKNRGDAKLPFLENKETSN